MDTNLNMHEQKIQQYFDRPLAVLVLSDQKNFISFKKLQHCLKHVKNHAKNMSHRYNAVCALEAIERQGFKEKWEAWCFAEGEQ